MEIYKNLVKIKAREEYFQTDIENNEIFAKECLKMIKYGMDNDLLIVPIIDVQTEYKTYRLNCHRNRWNGILKRVMKEHIKIEEYETCSNIKNIMIDNG